MARYRKGLGLKGLVQVLVAATVAAALCACGDREVVDLPATGAGGFATQPTPAGSAPASTPGDASPTSRGYDRLTKPGLLGALACTSAHPVTTRGGISEGFVEGFRCVRTSDDTVTALHYRTHDAALGAATRHNWDDPGHEVYGAWWIYSTADPQDVQGPVDLSVGPDADHTPYKPVSFTQVWSQLQCTGTPAQHALDDENTTYVVRAADCRYKGGHVPRIAEYRTIMLAELQADRLSDANPGRVKNYGRFLLIADNAADMATCDARMKQFVKHH